MAGVPLFGMHPSLGGSVPDGTNNPPSFQPPMGQPPQGAPIRPPWMNNSPNGSPGPVGPGMWRPPTASNAVVMAASHPGQGMSPDGMPNFMGKGDASNVPGAVGKAAP